AAPEGRAEPGLAVCLTVTHVDGLVLARSAFHHSINYRSVVVHGVAHQVTDPEEKRAALDALVDHVVPGRAADSRPANTKELAATAVLRLDLEEVSAKLRTGGVNDEPEDLALPHWAGVVPVRREYGTPLADADLAPGTGLPGYLAEL
ncbi:pyridoxamine 5'-phosphate oxidase family protein, partial [Streptomyces spiralis]